MIKLYFLPLVNTVWDEKDSNLLSRISAKRAKRVLRAKDDLDKRLLLYSALLTRNVLADILNLNNEELEFDVSEKKRPRLKNCAVDFNFSHTKNAILLGICDSGFVGVDIEAFRACAAESSDLPSASRRRENRPPPFKIAKKVFHPEEIAYINEGASKKNRRFLECWTRKEAYVKYLGTGISLNLSAINTRSGDISNAIYTFDANEYICSVCAGQNTFPGQALTFEDINLEYVQETRFRAASRKAKHGG